jgi:acetoin utilization deacetylase AcuC-like enzyme
MDLLIEQLEAMTVSSVPVCYVYDSVMTLHEGNKSHPERPDRVRTINDHLERLGLVERMIRVPSRVATEDELRLGHSEDVVKQVLNLNGFETSDDVLVSQKKLIFPFDTDTYVCHDSVHAARVACGSVLSMVDRMMGDEKILRGFAAIRPPGHHAKFDKPMGFCLFNNVAVAAEYVRKHHKVSRVAIIDWDVHHGNGTQNIFYESSDVLFISVHRHDSGKFYPGTGDVGELGEKQGMGYTINCPINGSYGDEELGYVFEHVILPSLVEFSPEFIFVSAGFDAAEHDPLGMCHVKPTMYGVLTKQLLNAFPTIPTLLVLEGGYNLKSIAQASVSCVESLLGIKPSLIRSPILSPLSSPSSSSSSGASSIRSVPHGVPKSSVVKMCHDLSEKLRELSMWSNLPVAPIGRELHLYPPVIAEDPTSHNDLLLSGGGHAGAIARFDAKWISKQTTLREALAYWLVESVRPDGMYIEVMLEDEDLVFSKLVDEEKQRIAKKNLCESLLAISPFLSRCKKIVVHNIELATIVIDDATHDFAPDDSLGVLDIKIGKISHTPDDSPGKVQTRRQKANQTSSGTLGMRITACSCADGFHVGKAKAQKLKRIDDMIPLMRRFLFSPVEDYHRLTDESAQFVDRLKAAIENIDLTFISASILFVVGRDRKTNIPLIHARLIDLAHIFPESGEEGLAAGCASLKRLLESARDAH